MATWDEVQRLKDGDPVDAATFNAPIGELTARTDYLKNRLEGLGDTYSNIQVQVTLSDRDTPDVGDMVCVDPDTKLFKKAVASMDLYDAYTASESAFAVGMLIHKSGSSGTVVLYGKVDLSEMDTGRLTDGGSFSNGQYYLSSTVPGKITRTPTGPRILLGFFCRNSSANGAYSGSFALLNPQQMDIEAHSHRTYVLKARPAGDVVADYDSVRVVGYYPDGFVPEDSNDEDFTGIPRLVLGGDYVSDRDASYTVTLSSSEGNVPTAWPCYLNWTSDGSDPVQSGRAEVGFFGDTVQIGSLGITARLEPSDGMSEEIPYQSEEDYRTWTMTRDRARGWSSSSVNVPVQFGANTVVFSGCPDKKNNDIEVVVPEKIYDLTAIEVSKGTRLTINGVTYVFVTAEDQDIDPDDVPVLIGQDQYETMVALCEKCDTAIYDEILRQVVCFSTINGRTPVMTNGDSPWFAVVYDKGTGESLSLPTGLYSVSRIDSKYAVVSLNNGMSYKIVGNYNQSVGDTANAAVFFPVPGAKYRYNIEFDNDLKKHFPPVPARSGSLMLNGVELESYSMFSGKDWPDSPAVYAIGDDSIYWRDDSIGRQPWPAGLPDVDIEDEYRLLFHFVSEFHSETGPVTSLHRAENSPITIKRCGTTDDATVGDLELDVDLTMDVSDMSIPGYKAVKTSRSGKLLLGPMVEKIVAGPGISIAKKSGQPDGQGTVTISADGAEYAGDFETVALENAKLESIGMFPYVRLLKWTPNSSSNVPTGFVAKFHVPATAEYGVYRVKFYATVFGESSFENEASQMDAGITMDYNILPDYNSVDEEEVETSNLKTGLIRPDHPFVLDVPFGVRNDDGSYSYTAYDPLLIHNDSSLSTAEGKSVLVLDHAFPTKDDCESYFEAHNLSGTVFGIKPGYTVSVRFSRSDPSGGTPYTGAVGILNLRWQIEQVVSVDVSSDDKINGLVAQTVLNLRKAAARSSRMRNSYDLVNILKRILDALK